MWFAIMHDTNKVIAEADTYNECSDMAFKELPWGLGSNGETAPYYLTTIQPTECSMCNGSTKVYDGYEDYTCWSCEGTGYSITSNILDLSR
jgi:hypothetical protein